MTAIDPGSGMVKKCREVCNTYDNIHIHQVSFEEFQSDITFDAIFAGTSLRWAPVANVRDAMIESCIPC